MYPDWQPIETAPWPTSDDGWHNWETPRYLIYDPGWGVHSAFCEPILEYPDTTHGPGILEGRQWWPQETYEGHLYHPTYWMPLPDPPEQR